MDNPNFIYLLCNIEAITRKKLSLSRSEIDVIYFYIDLNADKMCILWYILGVEMFFSRIFKDNLMPFQSYLGVL